MIAVIDYSMGNLLSVCNALEVLGADARVTSHPADLKEASAIVLPGVGAFGEGMRNLAERGLIDALNEEVMEKKKPYFGICLGLQFLARESLEFGSHDGLGWIDGVVKKIEPNDNRFKVPHMGWNDVEIRKPVPLFENLEEKPVFYFLHSFLLDIGKEEDSVQSATCWHGLTITAAVQRENIYAVQFHPEKSQKAGLKLLENFLKLV